MLIIILSILLAVGALALLREIIADQRVERLEKQRAERDVLDFNKAMRPYSGVKQK